MKKLCSLFCAIFMVLLIFCQPLALAVGVNNDEAVLEIAENWVKENYESFYNLRDLNAEIVRTVDTGATTKYTVAVTVETQLKADTVYDLPYVQGLLTAGRQRVSEDSVAEAAVSEFISNIDFSKEYNFMALDLVIMIDNNMRSNAEPRLYFQDGLTTTLHPIETLELDSTELYQEGKSALESIEQEYQRKIETPAICGYSTYDRIAARDYAHDWTGKNVTKCYDDGTSCDILQDRTKWNNSVYPYNSNFKHDDCTDFVSQCIHAGGIPIDTKKWDRNNDGDNGWAWTSLSGLKSYMTGKGYFDEGEFATANAGNVLCTSSKHVVLITLNDTYTHRYTGHTNDRYDQVFYDSTGFSYYTIKT